MRDAVAGLLWHAGQAASFWEVLAEQAVEVLVTATLPRAMRIREVAAHARRVFERFVAVEFGTVVPCDGRERQAAFPDQPQRGAIDGLARSMWERCHQRQTGTAINKRQQALPLAGGSAHRIALPVTRFLAQFDFGRTGVDHPLALQRAALFRPPRTLSSSLPALTQCIAQAAT